jgi:hypothetical protein
MKDILTYDDEELHEHGRKRMRESVRLHDYDDEEEEED